MDRGEDVAAMKVTLSPDEMAVASMIGCRRRIESLRAGSIDEAFADVGIRWAIDIDAACAELACCKALGWYWQGLGGPKSSGDIGKNVQVRSTRYPDGGLLIRPRDLDASRFLLVTCQAPDYVIVGWLTGQEAKQECFKRTRNNRLFWQVPQERLRPFELKTNTSA